MSKYTYILLHAVTFMSHWKFKTNIRCMSKYLCCSIMIVNTCSPLYSLHSRSVFIFTWYCIITALSREDVSKSKREKADANIEDPTFDQVRNYLALVEIQFCTLHTKLQKMQSSPIHTTTFFHNCNDFFHSFLYGQQFSRRFF